MEKREKKMSSTKSIATKNKPNASINKARNQLQLDQDLLCVMSQRSKVIDLYKTLLYMGRDYPKGYQYFRTKLKRAFDKNKTETDPEKIDKMISHGNFVIKELEALYMLRKYRTLKRRYYDQ